MALKSQNLGTAVGYLREQGVQGLILYSSFGLSGWVLARELSIFSAQQGVQLTTHKQGPSELLVNSD
jgi:hypothetical protein